MLRKDFHFFKEYLIYWQTMLQYLYEYTTFKLILLLHISMDLMHLAYYP